MIKIYSNNKIKQIINTEYDDKEFQSYLIKAPDNVHRIIDIWINGDSKKNESSDNNVALLNIYSDMIFESRIDVSEIVMHISDNKNCMEHGVLYEPIQVVCSYENKGKFSFQCLCCKECKKLYMSFSDFEEIEQIIIDRKIQYVKLEE